MEKYLSSGSDRMRFITCLLSKQSITGASAPIRVLPISRHFEKNRLNGAAAMIGLLRLLRERCWFDSRRVRHGHVAQWLERLHFPVAYSLPHLEHTKLE